MLSCKLRICRLCAAQQTVPLQHIQDELCDMCNRVARYTWDCIEEKDAQRQLRDGIVVLIRLTSTEPVAVSSRRPSALDINCSFSHPSYYQIVCHLLNPGNPSCCWMTFDEKYTWRAKTLNAYRFRQMCWHAILDVVISYDWSPRGEKLVS